MVEKSFNFRIDRLTAIGCPPEKQKARYYDTRVPGLTFRVWSSGAKAYIFYRRLPESNESPRKMVEIKLGKFGDISIEQARHKATELNYIIGEGKDPSIDRSQPLTYGELFERYIEDYAKLHTVTWQEMIKCHHRYFSQWHKRLISSIKRDQVQAWVNNIGTTRGKHTANRNFTTFRAVFTWSIGIGLFVGDNPCIGIKTFRTTARERFILPGDEFERFAKSLNEEENETIRDFFWICLFTGARCSNVLAMDWSQINFDLFQWRVPITKNGDSHTIPLTLNAAEILRRRKDDPNADPAWVFPSDRKGWRTGERRHLVAPRYAFKRIIERAGIKDLRIHDIRRYPEFRIIPSKLSSGLRSCPLCGMRVSPERNHSA